MISDAQFLEQDAKILDIFREEGLEKSLDPSQDAKASVNDLDVEDLRRIVNDLKSFIDVMNKFKETVYKSQNFNDTC